MTFIRTTKIVLLTSMIINLPILAAEGAEEWHRVRFSYTVQNKASQPVENVVVAIAEPSDGLWQSIDQFVLEGEASSTHSEKTDQFGQKAHVYTVSLKPGENRSFSYSCKFSCHPAVVRLDRNRVGTTNEVPQQIKLDYCVDVPRIYDLENANIKKLSSEFLSRYPNLVDRTLAIHSYVSSTIKYRSDKGWDSAPDVLDRGTGSCSEYSYLFSALLRGTGIPTRMAAGTRLRGAVPYTDQMGHRWCEVYLPGYEWVPFDPTMDSKNPAQARFVGTFFTPSLITTYGGGASDILGNDYSGMNTNRKEVDRERAFLWLD